MLKARAFTLSFSFQVKFLVSHKEGEFTRRTRQKLNNLVVSRLELINETDMKIITTYKEHLVRDFHKFG